jgi:hypothetical protein
MIDTDGPHSGPYPIGKNEGPATMAEPISYDDFAKQELQVAKVLEARPHPKACVGWPFFPLLDSIPGRAGR